MNKYQEMIYDYYIDKCDTKSSPDKLKPVVHYFYTGEKVNDFTETIDEISSVQMTRDAISNNIIKCIEQADMMINHADKKDVDTDDSFDSGDDYKAKQVIQALYEEDSYKADEENLKSKQDNVDDLLMTTAAGKYAENDPAQNFSDEDFEARRELMRKMDSPDVKSIMDCFGALYAHINAIKRSQVLPDPTNRSEITFGNDLKSMTFGEVVNMAVPEMEDLFYYRLASKQITQYKRERVQPVGKGSVDILLDMSGSMDAYMSFNNKQHKRFCVAIGATLAMMKSLSNDNRGFNLFVFSSVTRLFGTNKDSFPQLMNKLLKLTAGGGTHLETALIYTLENIEVSKSDADLMLVTDAEDMVRHDLVNKKKGDKRICTCHITSYLKTKEFVEPISDAYMLANDDGFFKFMEEVV